MNGKQAKAARLAGREADALRGVIARAIDALAAGDTDAAVDHLNAGLGAGLVDRAPAGSAVVVGSSFQEGFRRLCEATGVAAMFVARLPAGPGLRAGTVSGGDAEMDRLIAQSVQVAGTVRQRDTAAALAARGFRAALATITAAYVEDAGGMTPLVEATLVECDALLTQLGAPVEAPPPPAVPASAEAEG